MLLIVRTATQPRGQALRMPARMRNAPCPAAHVWLPPLVKPSQRSYVKLLRGRREEPGNEAKLYTRLNYIMGKTALNINWLASRVCHVTMSL